MLTLLMMVLGAGKGFAQHWAVRAEPPVWVGDPLPAQMPSAPPRPAPPRRPDTLFVAGRCMARAVGVSVGPAINNDRNGTQGTPPHNTSGRVLANAASLKFPVTREHNLRVDLA